jgi:hypothetical protein
MGKGVGLKHQVLYELLLLLINEWADSHVLELLVSKRQVEIACGTLATNKALVIIVMASHDQGFISSSVVKRTCIH